MLIKRVNQLGIRNWIEVSKSLPGRIGKQCRERWHKTLDPNICRSRWTLEEDMKLVRLYCIYGNKWSSFAKEFNGRTDS